MPRKKLRSGLKNEGEAPRTVPEKLELWRTRVARAERLRKDWESEYSVEECERFFLGKQGARGSVVMNHFTATIKTSRPNLFFSMPKFFVRPKPGRTNPISESKAAIGEGLLEAIARGDDNLEIAGALAVLQAYFRIGVLKVCYDPSMEPNPKKGQPIFKTQDGEPIMEEGVPVIEKDPLTGKNLVEPDEVLTDEVYRWRWVDAASMLLPDEGPDPSSWTWIGEEIVIPLEDAKEDARFKADLRANLRANRTTSSLRGQPQAKTRMSEPDSEMLKYCEVYDLKAKRWYVWADGQDFEGFLVDEPLPTWIDNDPYALLILGEPILGPEPSPWPVPVVRDWLDVQKEYNIRRKQITEGAKRSARKVLYEATTFDDEEEATKALQSPDDMQAAKVTDITKPPIVLVDKDLNPAIYRDIPMLQLDWRVITGQTGARLSDPDSNTATEAGFAERAANLRDADMQRIVVRWLASAGKKMLQCVKETMTLRYWIALREMGDKELQAYTKRVYGIEPEMLAMFPDLKRGLRDRLGQEKWLQITREELQFEADVTVVPGSTRPKTLDAERRSFIEVLKLLGAAPQLAMSPELLRRVLKMFEMEDDRLVEELVALSEKMTQVAANQAGRNQGGGGSTTGASTNGTTADGSLLAAVTGGIR